MLSGTPISLGSSDIVVGTLTIPFASITGLGPALSSSLSSAVASTSGGSSESTASTTQSGGKLHRSAAGELKVLGSAVILWLVLIALIISMERDDLQRFKYQSLKLYGNRQQRGIFLQCLTVFLGSFLVWMKYSSRLSMQRYFPSILIKALTNINSPAPFYCSLNLHH